MTKRIALVAVLFVAACGGGGSKPGADASGDSGRRDASSDTSADGLAAPADGTVSPDAGPLDAAPESVDAHGAEGDVATDGSAAGDGPHDVGTDVVDTTHIAREDTVVLPLEARALVYDHTRNRLYASVGGDAAAYPNRVVVIDPAHDAVVSTIAVGSDPGPLALSDDGSTLWVGLTGAKSIRKITLPTASAPDPVVGPLIHLPLDKGGFYFFTPVAMVVLPGAPDTLVLSMSDGTNSVVVLDAGVARQTAISLLGPDTLAAGPPGIVFGGSVNDGLSVCSITQFGVSQKQYSSFSEPGFYLNNRLYQRNGDILDVTDPLTPVRVGHFPVAGPIAERDASHVLILSSTGDLDPTVPAQVSLQVFDAVTFKPIAGVPLSLPALGPFGSLEQSPTSLVYAGDDAAAMIVTELGEPTRVAIVHSVVIRAPDLAPPVNIDGGIPVEGADARVASPEPCIGCTFTAVPAFGEHIVYDAVRNLVYLTADRAASVNKNTLVTVDPVTATVVSALPVGMNPGPLAISDDASTLWLGNTDDLTVQKVTLGTTQVAGTAHVLPAAMAYSTTPSTAQTIAVLPDAPTSIAVGISGPEIIILDDGVPRATVDKNPQSTASAFLTRGPGSTLFGYDTFNDFGVLDVSASGVTQTTFSALVDSNNLRSLVYLTGALYGNDGEIIDVTNLAAPVPGGRFDYYGDGIAVRGPNRLLMLIGGGSSTQTPVLRVLDTTTVTSVGGAFFPASALGRIPLVDDLVYIGGDAVAFLVYENNDRHLYIMHASVIGTPP